MRFYVHGAGQSGRAAWPDQDDADAVFADHSATSRMTEKAEAVGDQCPAGTVAVVAHSLGAVPVALAYRADNLAASHVVLLEPALYDVARGAAAVERHITAMTSARDRADEGDVFGFWQVVAPLMFGRPASRDTWADDRSLARYFAEMDPPWGYDIEASVFAPVPTLVITGSWNEEYEAIAERLSTAGALHVRLAGARHRPQDHPDFEPVVADFLNAPA
jgi:alpha-beta hydrolase superfamily lysophospholipase